MTTNPDYVGEELSFYEMPYGCEIVFNDGNTVVIHSPKDAKVLAESLVRMSATFEERDEEKE